MAITIIQKEKRKKIILIALVGILLAVLLYFVYATFMKKPAEPAAEENQTAVTSILSQKLKKLEIKWDSLNDERLQRLEAPTTDVSSLEVEESGRENPFLPY